MTKQSSRRGSAKVVVILFIVAFLGVAVVGAGALIYLNRDKFNLTLNDKAEDEEHDTESADSTAGSGPGQGQGLIPIQQLNTLRGARRKVVASSPVHATAQSYKRYANRSDVLILVDYYADWCPPCRGIAPHLSKLAAQHGDKVIVLKVNIDREKALAAKAGVRSIPDIRLLHGGKQLEKCVGGRPYSYFESLVLKHESKLAQRPAATATASVKPLPSKPSPTPDADPQAEPAIVPLKKDWLPPGVTRSK